MGRVTVQPAERLLWRKSRQEGENVMELSILIVDDDKILVDKLEETVNWEKIGISMVFTAYNIRQAQKLLKEFPIQFLLCDIDMPQGSGLELLEWIRDNQMEIECVFLSSYANFAYAQKALRLSTREYLLKPISNQDLEAVLSRIIEETREKRERRSAARNNADRPGDRKTEFWEKFFLDPSAQKEIPARAIEENLYQEQDRIALEAIKIFADDKDINYKKDLALFNFVIRNITTEFYENKRQNMEAVVQVSDYEWVLVFRVSEAQEFLDASGELKRYLNKILPQRSCMYIGESCSVKEAAESWKQIEIMEKTILPGEDGILRECDLHEYGRHLPENAEYQRPPWEVWQSALRDSEDSGEICRDICGFLKETFEKGLLTIENLERFLKELEQLIYCYLGEQQMGFSQLFDSREFDRRERDSYHSLSAVLGFVQWVFETLKGCGKERKSQEDVVSQVKDYIENHLNEELSRSRLAKIVFLSEDYVSKLFKTTTGMSIPGYIAARRIEKAKEYLSHSNLPVSRIALEVGYSNFSYFSKTFRDLTGMTPNEYRNQTVKQNTPRK